MPAQVRPLGKPAALKISEAAQILHVSESSIRRLIRRGDLRGLRIIRHLLIPAEDIERLLQAGETRKADGEEILAGTKTIEYHE